MTAQPRYLLLSDFDGTIAETFTPSPHGIGVKEGYLAALDRLFGQKALPLFEEIGGIGNRAPVEIMRAILHLEPTLTQGAWARIKEDLPHLLDREQEDAMAEALVLFKLEVIIAEIGPSWPLPCTGFLDLAGCLGELDNDIKIELGIVTAGHKLFIKRTFQTWGIHYPTVAVTDDDIRWRKRPRDIRQRVKPAVFPFRLAMQRWMRRPEGKSLAQVAYFGDDQIKDGGLARNAQVPFGLFGNGTTDPSDFPAGTFSFSDWRQIAIFIIDHLADFRQGKPCSEILATFPRQR